MFFMSFEELISLLDFVFDPIFDHIDLGYLGLVNLNNLHHIINLLILLDLQFHKFILNTRDLIILKLNIRRFLCIFLSQQEIVIL